MSGQVDMLYIYLLLVAGVMTTLIFLAVTVLAIKYRRKPGVEAHQIEGSTILEITWSIIPFGVMLTFFIWGAVIFFQERTPPADSTEVYVVAKQWMWKIEHMEGQREINELHVPTGQNVKLIMTSQDVIHSFFIPRIPHQAGRAARPLYYALVQSDQAGPLSSVLRRVLRHHALRHGRRYRRHGAAGVRAVDGRRGPPRALQETGKQLFSSLGCSTCHRSDVQGRGPNLAGIYNKPVLLEDGRTVVADENYVRESILNPTAKIVSGFKPVMPTFQGIVSEEQLNALVAYVKSLSQPTTGTAQASQAAASPEQSSNTQQVQ